MENKRVRRKELVPRHGPALPSLHGKHPADEGEVTTSFLCVREVTAKQR
jgi:hypothetical protein